MNKRVEDPEWIVPMLFQCAMSKDQRKWCQENALPDNLIAAWKERYHGEYITYIENMLRVIRDRVD